MGPNSMRRIDFWVGVPICFFLTGIYRIQRMLGFKNPRFDEKPKNVLFIELIEMGTSVIAYPAMKEFKNMYPDSNIHFLLFEQIKETMEILNIVPKENIITIDSSSAISLAKDTLRFMWLARKKKIDTTINLQMFVRYSTILSYLSGARKRVGFYRFTQEGIYIGDFLTHKVTYNPHIHTLHSFFALINALQVSREQNPLVKFPIDQKKLKIPKISSDQSAKEKMWEILKDINPDIDQTKKLVIVNPNASELFGMRKLPIENYAMLIEMLLQDEDVYVAISGVESEKPDAEYICSFVKSERVLDLTGKTTLRQLLDLFNIAKILITNDSGPAHFASLTNIHIVVFFGPELPERYTPLTHNYTVIYSNYVCSPCVSPYNQRLTPCNDNLCLKTINIDYVYNIVKTILYKNDNYTLQDCLSNPVIVDRGD
jgi:ADP-heptose:LPS heptosyltransferase